MKFVR